LAFDLGASNWRAALAHQEGPDIRLEVIHREDNSPVEAEGGLFWDIHKIFAGMRRVLRDVAGMGVRISSIGIDSWSVDYGLLDDDGVLLELPRCYRDTRNQGTMEELAARLGIETLFSRTAVLAEDLTTLCQLFAARKQTPELLKRAAHLLFIPDLLRYWVCGESATDFTLATTSQLYNLKQRTWDEDLMAQLDLPRHILPRVLGAGTILGPLEPHLQQETGLGPVPVVTGASHDTAAAFLAAAAGNDCAILSSGTWSILGVNLPDTLPSAAIDPRRFGYEGNPDGSVRLVHNVPGMWLLERCRVEWKKMGVDCNYDELFEAARRCEDFVPRIDPHWQGFAYPENMLDAIRYHLLDTGQPAPRSPGEFTRAILSGLAESYAHALDELRALANRELGRLIVVGGGAQNGLLNELTTRRARVVVTPGFIEATILGNVKNQALALAARRDAA
jgi:sugar (pentulose or hexulose) kinase